MKHSMLSVRLPSGGVPLAGRLVVILALLSASPGTAVDLVGKVLDVRGVPVAGARVEVKDHSPTPKGLGETTSDETGRFAFTLEKAGRCQVVAERDGVRADFSGKLDRNTFVTLVLPPSFSRGSDERTAPPLSLKAGASALHRSPDGHVEFSLPFAAKIQEERRPIAAAGGGIPGDLRMQMAILDDRGYFVAVGVPGPMNTFRQASAKELVDGLQRGIQAPLEKKGLVASAPSERPVTLGSLDGQEVTVELKNSNGGERWWTRTRVFVQPDAMIVLLGFGKGRTVPDSVVGFLDSVSLLRGEKRTARETPRPSTASTPGRAPGGRQSIEVGGRVYDGKNKAVSGAVVVVSPVSVSGEPGPESKTETGADGTFQVTLQAAGTYSFTAASGGSTARLSESVKDGSFLSLFLQSAGP